MTSTYRIVVGSEGGRRALRWAIHEPKKATSAPSGIPSTIF